MAATVRAVVLAACGLVASPVSVADRFTVSSGFDPLSQPEPILAQVLRDIEIARLDRALERVDALLESFPNFRLGHLIRGDLLMARARPLVGFGNADNAPADRISDLREEAVVRLKGYRDKPAPGVLPRYLLQMPPEQKYAVLVDTQRSRLYLYENDGGRPRYVADYYITQGKAGADKTQQGDRKTPVGVYFVTANLARDKLSDFYGSGAFPINYPNEWDKRLGRSGYGIWLHGTPSDTFSRPPRASDGCVVLANPDIDALSTKLQVGVTPVIISNSIEWSSNAEWTADRDQLSTELEQWRRDAQGKNAELYLRHYSATFAGDKMNLDQWVQARRVGSQAPADVRIETRNVSMFRSPGKEDLIVVTFDQDYRSDNVVNVVKKRQYWIKEQGRWKIIYEGKA